MGRFLLRGVNAPPKQVPSRDYFAEPPWLRPELTPKTIVIGLKKCTHNPERFFFPPIPECISGVARPYSTVWNARLEMTCIGASLQATYRSLFTNPSVPKLLEWTYVRSECDQEVKREGWSLLVLSAEHTMKIE